MSRDRIDHQDAAALTDAGRHHARLESGHVTMERPCEIQWRVAFESHALSLSGVAGVQRRIAKIERGYFGSD